MLFESICMRNDMTHELALLNRAQNAQNRRLVRDRQNAAPGANCRPIAPQMAILSDCEASARDAATAIGTACGPVVRLATGPTLQRACPQCKAHDTLVATGYGARCIRCDWEIVIP